LLRLPPKHDFIVAEQSRRKNSGEFIMARFNTKAAKAQPTSRVTSTGRVLRTHQGGRA
jgi:hypothetical protein